MDHARVAATLDQLRQLRAAQAEQPVEFIAALGQALAEMDIAEIKAAIPVYCVAMDKAGRPLARPYVRALGVMLDAARALSDATGLALTRWRDTAGAWPPRH